MPAVDGHPKIRMIGRDEPRGHANGHDPHQHRPEERWSTAALCEELPVMAAERRPSSTSANIGTSGSSGRVDADSRLLWPADQVDRSLKHAGDLAQKAFSRTVPLASGGGSPQRRTQAAQHLSSERAFAVTDSKGRTGGQCGRHDGSEHRYSPRYEHPLRVKTSMILRDGRPEGRRGLSDLARHRPFTASSWPHG